MNVFSSSWSKSMPLYLFFVSVAGSNIFLRNAYKAYHATFHHISPDSIAQSTALRASNATLKIRPYVKVTSAHLCVLAPSPLDISFVSFSKGILLNVVGKFLVSSILFDYELE
jgi:hypothetical protein